MFAQTTAEEVTDLAGDFSGLRLGYGSVASGHI